MAFSDTATSIKAKLHLNGLSRVSIIGIATISFLLVSLSAYALAGGFSPHASSILKADAGAPSTAHSDEAIQAPSASAPRLSVHVVGAVLNPGVYEFSQGMRVRDAVDAAGGFSQEANAESVNLARILSDGEQIAIPSSKAQASPGATEPQGIVNGKIDINTATVEQLVTLDGVGEATARKIVESRQNEGPFSSIEDIQRVSGIGAKKYAALASSITVG